MQRGAGAERSAREPGEIPDGMDARAVVGQHPSMEAAARRLLLQRRGFQHHRRLTETPAALALIASQVAHPRAAMRQMQPAALRVRGVRRLCSGGPCDERVGVDARIMERASCGAVSALQRVEVASHTGVDHAGVAPTRPLTKCTAVDDDHALAMRCNPHGGGEPGESRTDDHNISSLGERRFRDGGERRVVPPQRCLAVALGKRRSPRARLTWGRPDAHNLRNSDKFDRWDSVAAARTAS